MDRKAYDRYLERFNARDYDAVLDHFAPRFEVSFGGYCLRTPSELRKFYGFLHHYVRESITVDEYLSNGSMIAIEARVRLEGLRELPRETATDAGFGDLLVPAAGQVVVIPQFIHYHLSQGKFTKALCAIYQPPR